LVRLGFIVVLVALIGLLISGLVALRVYEQEMTIEQSVLARAIEGHARVVQERLSERELLTRVAVGLIKSEQPLHPNALQPLRSSIYAFKTDFVVATWVAHIGSGDIARAEQVLAESDYPQPALRKADDTPLATPPAERFNVLMDIEPRSPETLVLPGRLLDKNSVMGPALIAAAATRAPAASDPLILPRSDNRAGIVLAAPAYSETGTLAGFITFSYLIGPLLLDNDALSQFTVTLRDARDPLREFVADGNGNVGPATAIVPRATSPVTVGVTFGGRSFDLLYYAKIDPTARAQSLAAIVMIVGISLTSILCGLFGYVAYSNLRLSREIAARISFEARLGAVIAELNHRVKNILAVIQSIVTRTIRPGVDIDIARELLIGRIHAMSHVVSLLSDSHWQGAQLRGLLTTRAIPHAERIISAGPDIIVSARAAQSLCLVFFELASHAAIGNDQNIMVQWHISGKPGQETFLLTWEEPGATPTAAREDGDFGAILLDRVAPEALGGTSKRYFTATGYVFEITAPLQTVIDKVELSRTNRLAGLPPPA
jgi:two-component sensor histidine kinase